MSAYTDLLASYAPGFWYAMEELSGDFQDGGALNLDLTPNGTLVRGEASIIPADSRPCVSQATAKGTPMAARGDNGVWDHPSPANALTLMAWVQPDTLKGNAPLISKFPEYRIYLAGSKVGMYVDYGGAADLQTPQGVVVPGNPLLVQARFDGAAGQLALLVNGVVMASRSITPGNWTVSTGAVRVGGFTEFGSFGMDGKLQDAVIWHALPTVDNLRELYMLGVTDEAEVAGSASNVMPWSRSILDPNPARERVTLSNESDKTIYVGMGASVDDALGAFVVQPKAHRVIEGYTGELSAKHDSTFFGAKRLLIAEQ